MIVRALALSMLLLAGCGGISVRYHSRTAQLAPAIDPRYVAIYTLTPPGMRYEVTGTLYAEAAAFDWESGPRLLARLRVAAAQNGCRALLIDHGYCVEDGGGSAISTSQASLEVNCIEVHP